MRKSIECQVEQKQDFNFTEGYNLGDIRNCSVLKGGYVNKSIVVDTSKGEYFLRLRPKASRGVVEQEALLLEYLNSIGVNVPRPIKHINNAYVSETPDGSVFFATEFIKGGMSYEDGSDVSDSQLANAAKFLANYHLKVKDEKVIPFTPGSIFTEYTSSKFFDKEDARDRWEKALAAISRKMSIDRIDSQVLSVA